jgi:hypothetical protein
VPAEILAWAKSLQERVAKADAPRKPTAAKEAIFYLCNAWAGDDVELHLLKARLGPDGELTGHAGEWSNYEQALLKPPSFVREEDMQVFRLLRATARKGGYGRPLVRGAEGLALLEAALLTGRTYLALDDSGHVTRLAGGPARAGRLDWQPAPGGLKAVIVTEPAASLILRTEPPAYLDAERHEAGRVSIDGGAAIAEVLALPPLSPIEVPVVASALAAVAPALPSPQGPAAANLPCLDVPCQPVLGLQTLHCWSRRKHRGYDVDYSSEDYDVAVPTFCYGEARFEPGTPHDVTPLPDGRVVRVKRDLEAEATAWRAFLAAGFLPVKPAWIVPSGPRPDGVHGLESEAHWAHFFALTARPARIKRP